MITDFWTKSGSHYRRDDVANTVECVGPEPFPPHKVTVTDAYSPPTVGRRFVALWDGPGPVGKAVMHTSTVVRVELEVEDEPSTESACGDDCGVHAPGCDDLQALATEIDRQAREMVEVRRYLRRALRRIIRGCRTLQRELNG
jgi:hypothetical protein